MSGVARGAVMVDVAGLTLSAEERRRLTHPQVGGLILFARNFTSREQLIGLVDEIRAVRPEILVAVDHEGGRVQRFRTHGFTALPAMRALGELWDSDPAKGAIQACALATAIGYVLARELLACGIDLSFTPVLDLDYGLSAVIGDRAFHHDPRVVTLLAKSVNHGLLLAGMANCGKHFPGHGYVVADSHVAMPVDERPLAQILGSDVQPYEWLGSTLTAVMPAHVIYRAVDDRPAGFSRRWLQEILRGKLGFGGVIFSDDLSMQGAQIEGGVCAAAHLALAAGCDMVLVCNDAARAEELLAGLDWRTSQASVARLARLYRGTKPGMIDLRQDEVYQVCMGQLREHGGRSSLKR